MTDDQASLFEGFWVQKPANSSNKVSGEPANKTYP
jgi:hypothetical protein